MNKIGVLSLCWSNVDDFCMLFVCSAGIDNTVKQANFADRGSGKLKLCSFDEVDELKIMTITLLVQ